MAGDGGTYREDLSEKVADKYGWGASLTVPVSKETMAKLEGYVRLMHQHGDIEVTVELFAGHAIRDGVDQVFEQWQRLQKEGPRRVNPT